MQKRWIVLLNISRDAYEYVGEAEGETFEEACRALARADAGFAKGFDARRMTCRGSELTSSADDWTGDLVHGNWDPGCWVHAA